MSSTCFERPSVHPEEDLYVQFYAISFIHPYKQSGQWKDVSGTDRYLVWRWLFLPAFFITPYRCISFVQFFVYRSHPSIEQTAYMDV